MATSSAPRSLDPSTPTTAATASPSGHQKNEGHEHHGQEHHIHRGTPFEYDGATGRVGDGETDADSFTLPPCPPRHPSGRGLFLGPGPLDGLGHTEVVYVAEAHHLVVDEDGGKDEFPFLQPLDYLGELLSHRSPRQVVVVHLDAVSVFPGQIPGDDLRNLLLRLRRPSTATAEAGAGGVVEDVDDVPRCAVRLHSTYLI